MSRLQKVVSKLEDWGLSRGLKYNPTKREVIIFTKQHHISPPNKLQVSGHPVPFTNSAKYLGVTLDSILNWNLHLTKQVTKCKKYLFMLQKGVKQAWGPKPTYIRWVYTAIVRPKLACAALSWGHIARFTRKHDYLINSTGWQPLSLPRP